MHELLGSVVLSFEVRIPANGSLNIVNASQLLTWASDILRKARGTASSNEHEAVMATDLFPLCRGEPPAKLNMTAARYFQLHGT